MHKIGSEILSSVLWVLGQLPLCVHYAFSDILAFFTGRVFRYRRKVVEKNLVHAFPDLTDKERRRLISRFYRHFTDIFVEAVWFGGCTNPSRLRRSHIVEIENPELLNELHEKSPSVVMLNSHCGNWELFGGIGNYDYKGTDFKVKEENMCVVYKRLSSRLWDEVMNRNRIAPLLDKKRYEGLIESRDILRYAISHKGEKKFYNFNTDQYPYKGAAGIDVGEFLHQPTMAMAGGITLARKMSMSVVYLNIWLERRGHYRMRFTTICEDASTMTVEEILRRYYDLLQKDIEAQPWNYLWTHKRWKNNIKYK